MKRVYALVCGVRGALHSKATCGYVLLKKKTGRCKICMVYVHVNLRKAGRVVADRGNNENITTITDVAVLGPFSLCSCQPFKNEWLI